MLLAFVVDAASATAALLPSWGSGSPATLLASAFAPGMLVVVVALLTDEFVSFLTDAFVALLADAFSKLAFVVVVTVVVVVVVVGLGGDVELALRVVVTFILLVVVMFILIVIDPVVVLVVEVVGVLVVDVDVVVVEVVDVVDVDVITGVTATCAGNCGSPNRLIGWDARGGSSSETLLESFRSKYTFRSSRPELCMPTAP